MFLFIFLLFTTKSDAFYSSNSNVVELTADNFPSSVINVNEIWIVEFFATWCGHCRNFVQEYEKAAKALNGIIKVGAVNCENYTELCDKYDVGGYPTVKIFNKYKNKPVEYTGELNAQGLIDVALETASKRVKVNMETEPTWIFNSGDVMELTDDNFETVVVNSNDSWMVKFYAPWCIHCKNLAPEWADAATEMKGKVKFGALDATTNLKIPELYTLTGYPTIKFYPPGEKSFHSAERFNGGRTSEDIIQWLNEKLSESDFSQEVKQLIDQPMLDEICGGKILCVITFLPHIFECGVECRNEYLETLTVLKEIFKKHNWGWLWSEGGAQKELETVLEIGGFGYPTLSVINLKKMRYTLFKGSFCSIGIQNFLKEITRGKGSTSLIKSNQFPVIATVIPWDGTDVDFIEDVESADSTEELQDEFYFSKDEL